MGTGKIQALLVEDDPIFREQVVRATFKSLSVTACGSIADAKRALEKTPFSVVFLDRHLPDGIGNDLIPLIQCSHPTAVVIMLTADSNHESVVDALEMGASDYLVKSADIARELSGRVAVAKARLAIEQRCRKAELLADDFFSSEIIGQSPGIHELREQIRIFGPSNVNVLIRGETGTGKELVARALNLASRDRARPFVTLNCGAIQPNLIESELFGHVKGAFTGASSDKVGRIELAHGGDLFLDEIGELPVDLQAKLLRVLQDGEYYRVGSNDKRIAKIRIVSATHQDLETMIEEGKFRSDLYYRVNGTELFTVPLRDRREDIPRLVEHFIRRSEGPRFTATNRTLVALQSEAWIGNVRELKNRIDSAIARAKARQSTELLPEDFTVANSRKGIVQGTVLFGPQSFKARSFHQFIQTAEKDYLVAALKHYSGDVARTAAALNLSISTLYRKLNENGIKRTLSQFEKEGRP